MLRSLNEISSYNLTGIDDDIGRCKDFLFDDRHWCVRYLVADTHTWLPGGRKIVISPVSIGEPDWKNSQLPISLTIEGIKNSPPLDEHKPVSRDYEMRLNDYYDYGYYWLSPEAWGSYAYPYSLVENKVVEAPEQAEPQEGHLRSANEVNGYGIQAVDGSIGHVEDFILDDENWAIAYLVVDTRNWFPGGRKVLISPKWLKSVSWANRYVAIRLTMEQIKESPQYDPDVFIDPDYENLLHSHYGFPKNR